ncbi:hypothetical protein STSP2_00289 [Anaerohalosphaera lusitana]|uniref:Peptidase M60 domain-containing protein n=1 Tax=Anaerohalosphaera lusitana TaxID=1936003 RepID=A0A1U9NHB3_9BACT|nr:M60 family metallopeptidase [Anaerohalosphaera lusitana]AQT67148.1 hypothetical protein STSP2_00289 [Anaerohalosphaera lusitana]
MRTLKVLLALIVIAVTAPSYAADPFQATDDIFITTPNTAKTCYVLLNEAQAFPDTTVTLVSFDSTSSQGGSVTGNGDGTVTYTPPTSFAGRDSFTYTSTDGLTNSTATVTINVNQTFNGDTARNQILNGVTSLANPSGPGYMVSYGQTAYSISHYNTDRRNPQIAASTIGQGRVIALPDHQWLNMDSYGSDTSTGNFYRNGLEWLAGTTNKNIKIVVTSSTGAATWIQQQGYTNVVQSSDFQNQLSDADVLVGWLGSGISNANCQAVIDFVANGGGLFICDYGIGYDWWWGKAIPDAPGNRVCRHAGIGFKNSWPGGSLPINRSSGQTDSDDVINILAGSGSYTTTDRDIAGTVLDGIYNTVASDDALVARMDYEFYERIQTINPSPSSPVSDEFEKALLKRECQILLDTPVEETVAHRTAQACYGTIPADAQRVTKTLSFSVTEEGRDIRGNDSGIWLSTGLYAVPGEIVTVSTSDPITNLGMGIKINGDWNNVSDRGSYLRMPFGTSRDYALNQSSILTANPFGGIIYITIPRNTVPGDFDITIENAIEAPYFIQGVHTNEDWLNEIRNKPAPFAELVSDNMIISLSKDKVTNLEDPEALMEFWEQGLTAQDDLAGLTGNRTRQTRMYSMIQTAWGSGYAGYPIGAWNWDFANLQSLEQGYCWGQYHETGHLHQSGYWTDGRTGEVTVNIFSMVGIEAACDSGQAGTGWSRMWDTDSRVDEYRNARLAGGFDEVGVGTRLVMYAQLRFAFGWDAFKQTFQTYHDDQQNASWKLPTNDQEEWDQFMTRFSRVVGFDLSPFFINWDFGVSQTAINSLSDLPAWNMVETKPDSATVTQGKSVVLPDVAANDYSFDGTLNVTGYEDPANGTVTDNGDGTFTYTPDPGFEGQETLTYIIENGYNNQFRESVQITVNTVESALLGHWPLDANGWDYSQYGNDATLNGTYYVGGLLKYSIKCDGYNDYLDVGTGPSISGYNDFTVSAWIKTRALQDQVIVQQRDSGYNGQYVCKVESNGTLTFYVYGDYGYQFDFYSAERVNDYSWHHVAFVREGENGYIYTDGVLTASASGSIKPLDSNIGTYIGADVRDGVDYFNGNIDDVAIWEMALGETDIQNIYEKGMAGKTFRYQTSGEQGFKDLAIFSANWLDTNCRYCNGANLDWDSDVDFDDLEILASQWLQPW